ncbi:hypothetical protein SAMN05216326_13925 [Nitrosomonas marina]|uniref:Uncharacterized protein n=1 Tax=Nitrosomonas marina TaxID=917 RepID=A0A1I0FK52_9PROT|nr:hypothetical protein SAMN05216326_13925 [Nitrosomonas marina]
MNAMPKEKIGLSGISYIEFWVGNAKQASYYLRKTMEFCQIGYLGPETGIKDYCSGNHEEGHSLAKCFIDFVKIEKDKGSLSDTKTAVCNARYPLADGTAM